MTQTGESFARAVQQDFAFLFSDFGFRLVHEEETRAGEHRMVVLESDRARIKIELDQGTRVVYFGARDAPISWADNANGVVMWFVDNALLNFIEHRDGITKHASGAERLRSHVAEIVAAFAPERPHEWWRAFDSFRADRLRHLREHR